MMEKVKEIRPKDMGEMFRGMEDGDELVVWIPEDYDIYQEAQDED